MQQRSVPCVDEEDPAGYVTVFCQDRCTVIFKSLEALGGKTFLKLSLVQGRPALSLRQYLVPKLILKIFLGLVTIH